MNLSILRIWLILEENLGCALIIYHGISIRLSISCLHLITILLIMGVENRYRLIGKIVFLYLMKLTIWKAYVQMRLLLTCLLRFLQLAFLKQKIVLTFLHKEGKNQLINHVIQITLQFLEAFEEVELPRLKKETPSITLSIKGHDMETVEVIFRILWTKEYYCIVR